tara:strand:- start:3136 stop:4332 length:1197 start_codon:yes stop_codon:yes gene_type:complete
MYKRTRFYLFLLVLLSSSVSAHQRSESYSKVLINHYENNFEVETVFSIQLSVLSKMQWPLSSNWEQEVLSHVKSNFYIDSECEFKETPKFFTSTTTGYIRLSWSEECQGEVVKLKNNAFFDLDTTHAHISTFKIDGQSYPEKLFTSQSRSWQEGVLDRNRGNENEGSIWDYFLLGIKHISTGYDHIAFLLGIILLNRRKRSLLIAITGFTLGHSLTLALGVMNFVSPSTSFVESLIGYSILLISLEFLAKETEQYELYSKSIFFISIPFLIFYSFFGINSYLLGLFGIVLFTISYFNLSNRLRDFNLSIAVTALFGLVHGFGFAGTLTEVGLPEDRIVSALLGFNLGVEIGQIAIVLLFFLIVSLLRNIQYLRGLSLEPLAAVFLASLGSFWFIERIF